jgi:hypothetical protein
VRRSVNLTPSHTETLSTDQGQRVHTGMDKAALGALREELAPILTKMFQLMDSDGSGAIGEVEGVAVGRELGPQDPEKWWKTLLDNADKDRNGEVDLDEYLDYMTLAYASIGVTCTNAKAATTELQMVYERLEAGLTRQRQQQARSTAED